MFAEEALKEAKDVIKNEHMISKASHYLHMNDIDTKAKLKDSLEKAQAILGAHVASSHVRYPYSSDVLYDVEDALDDLNRKE